TRADADCQSAIAQVASSEACNPDAAGFPFECIMNRVMLFSGAHTDYSMPERFRQRVGVSQLLLARDLKLLHPNDYETLSRQTIEIKRMLTVLVQKLTAKS